LWYYEFDPGMMHWGTDPPASVTWLLRLIVWAAIAMTIYSGWGYVKTAMRLVRT
jgi:hypothetical protein